MAYSMAAVLLAGARMTAVRAAPREHSHPQPWGGMQGQAPTYRSTPRKFCARASRLNQILANHTHQKIEKVTLDTERDYFLTSQAAKEYGLIDDIILSRPSLVTRKQPGQGAEKEKERSSRDDLPTQEQERRVKRHRPKCSFCGKLQGEGGVRLVAGSGVFICSECISLANEILWGHNPRRQHLRNGYT